MSDRVRELEKALRELNHLQHSMAIELDPIPQQPRVEYWTRKMEAVIEAALAVGEEPACSLLSTSSGLRHSSATAPNDIAVAVGLAIYARMVRLSHDSNQTVGEKRDYYVTLHQLEEAFVQMRDEVRR